MVLPHRASAPSNKPTGDEIEVEAPLPQRCVFSIAPYTPDLPGLVPDLHLPGTLVGFLALKPRCASLSRVRTQIRHSPPRQVDVFRMGQPAFAPSADSEAVGVLLLPERTRGSATGSGFSQIRARGTTVERRSDDRPRPVLQALGAARAARGPAGELGHNTVPWAGHQAGLLSRRLRREILTYFVGDDGSVQLLEAADTPVLQPVLCGDTVPGCHLSTSRGDEPTPVPSRNLPLEQLQVPVTDFKAPPLALRFVLVVAVGVVRCPALGVGAPDGPTPNAPRATVTYAPAPVTCKREGVEKHHIIPLPPICPDAQ